MIRKGTYVLFVTLDHDAVVTVGSLGSKSFSAGCYCYVGSAMGGLDQRIRRHLSKEKTIRWHIDNLTLIADKVEAFESYPDFIQECRLAEMVLSVGGVSAVDGFGCSDCKCDTHLFQVTDIQRERVVSEAHLVSFSSIQ